MFDLIVNADFLIRKISLTLNNVVKNDTIKKIKEPSLFTDLEQKENKNSIKEEKLQKLDSRLFTNMEKNLFLKPRVLKMA
ncbi:hypothetical protein ACOTVD_09815 [Campylobacter jejuni]|uniref:hypothetical protein n=1 Tax=Campylobacter jejuni TaxID=197 RepID=UPI003B99D3AC